MKPTLILSVSLLLGFMARHLDAQERFIRVTSTGSVQVKPDTATITAYVIGSGDTIDEATKDYEEKLTKATEAFDPMEYRDVKVSISQPSFTMGAAGSIAAMMGGMGAAAPDDSGAFQAHCAFKVEIPLNEELAQEKINSIVNHVVVGIDKAGMKWTSTGIPQTNVVVLSLSNRSTALDQAMAKASEEARRKAAVIAELNGKELSEVISVEETNAAPSSNDPSSPYSQVITMYTAMLGGSANSNSNEGLIEVTSHLEVTFAIK